MGSETSGDKQAIRFLNFSNTEKDAEKTAKLKEAAAKIEQAIAREKAVSELIDYQEKEPEAEPFDPANDTRPLYERLQEQKNKKKEMIEESQKLSNMVTKLDEDDANYLSEVVKNKREEELKKRLEVYDAMETKKRLDEQRVLEEEKRLKESLLVSGLNRRNGSLHNKSKLSLSIKVRPKPKPSLPEKADEPSKKKLAQTTDEWVLSLGSCRSPLETDADYAI